MDKSPSILVAVPYHPAKAYCFKQLMHCLDNLEYDNKEILMRWDPSEYGSQDAVKKQREFFRSIALARGFDYLYFLGADTLPPADVLARMVETATENNIHIIGGVYWGRHGAENGIPQSAVAWLHDNSLTEADRTKIFAAENTLLKVDGMGMDCVLIHRSVLEEVSWLDWKQNDDDYPFYDLAKQKGFEVWVDTGIQCRHYFDSQGYTYLGKIHRVISTEV